MSWHGIPPLFRFSGLAPSGIASFLVWNRWGIAVEWKAMEWRARRAAFMLSLIFHNQIGRGSAVRIARQQAYLFILPRRSTPMRTVMKLQAS